MALGRSNSLSINTGATNSLFSQQQQQQPPSSNTNTGSLFGGSNTQQPQAQSNNTTGGLFGSNTQQPQAQSNNTTGGLFGSNTQQNQPQQTTSLFGNSTQQSQPQQSSSIFGNTGTQNQNAAGSTSIFGGGNAQQSNNSGLGGGLFGSTLNTQQNQPQGNSSIFGGPPKNTQSTSMFAQPNKPASGGLFSSGFGSAPAQQPQPTVPSLLGATQHAQMNNSAPFGRLSMGQSAAGAQPTVGAVKINYDGMRSTTRFEDCVDSVKHELEEIDKMIQAQENFAKQIEAFLPRHETDVMSIGPDVEFVKSKAEDVELALATDAQGVEAQRKNAEQDRHDVERCQRILTNLTLPQSHQFSNMNMSSFGSLYGSQQQPQQQPVSIHGADATNYDTDLIGNYFIPKAAELQQTMTAYANTLGEIESHMRVIESSAAGQAQQLAMRRSGMNGASGQVSSDDTVRELADTLRGFEQSILGVAGVVGECREGVNELVLGRLGNPLGARP